MAGDEDGLGGVGGEEEGRGGPLERTGEMRHVGEKAGDGLGLTGEGVL